MLYMVMSEQLSVFMVHSRPSDKEILNTDFVFKFVARKPRF